MQSTAKAAKGMFELSIRFNDGYAAQFLSEDDLTGLKTQVSAAHKTLNDRSGLGNDFLGWADLPVDYDKEEFARIKKAAEKIISDTDVFIVIGIGGSYLGARAAIEFLKSPLYNNLPKKTPDIYFSGNSISGSAVQDLLKICEGKRVSVNVISKSGTTTEPAIAFRIFREYLENRYGHEEAVKRIYCTTDKARGTLKQLADEQGYESFVVPDDVGGRFSVLTAVGLLPIAVAGADIDALMKGAAAAREDYMADDIENNDCYKYAALRNAFYRRGKEIELLVSYEPRFALMAEWFKQLYGESEGKNGKGLFPASVNFTTDLHSMGQYIQDGERTLFETIISVAKPAHEVVIEAEAENLDGLNFLAGKRISEVNRMAELGVQLAHVDGGVPNIRVEIPAIDAHAIGSLLYFFEKACGISGYILGVNPFDQPGVEAYKKNMFALLDKPGYEEASKAIKARL